MSEQVPYRNGCQTMPRLIGIILIVIAVAGVIIHSALGLHIYINEVAQSVFGDSATQTYGSAIGEGVVYLVFYFIGAAGLAFLAVGGRRK